MITTNKFRNGLRNRVLAAAVVAAALVCAPSPAHATAKEIIELQTQVQQLLDMVQRLQSTMDSRFGVIQQLAQQTADNANQVTATVNALQQKLNVQNEAVSGKLDVSSGQTQSLNDSVDELKSRVAKLDKAIQDMQAQLQTIQTQTAPQTPAQTPSGGASSGTPAGTGSDPSGPSATTSAGQPPVANQAANQAPPLEETFQAGMRDLNAAKYMVAEEEFQDVVHYYPQDDMAGSAQFYLGEIAYKQEKYNDAIKDYNAVLEQFSGSFKAPAAQLHKGLALLALDKKEAGANELRSLIRRYPQAPEAAQARSKLNALGVKIAVAPAH
jgi:tol-pal system protein YbgF